MGQIIDITRPVRAGGAVYPGNPEIRFTPVLAVARGDSANVTALAFGTHTATHVDAPNHFRDDAPGVDALPLDRLLGPALVLAFDDSVRAVGAAELQAHDLGGARRVLLRTGNSSRPADAPFTPDYAYIAPDGAEYLVARGVELVGVDYLSVERFKSGDHRTHDILLDNGVVIVEGLALGDVAPGRYELCCLPLRLAGLDGAPARAVLIDGGR